MENYTVKAKVVCSIEKRNEEGKNELDKEIEIEIEIEIPCGILWDCL